ncbi:hypothetical protein KFK09_018514 [Dendrobium nobile]|uniref:Uncharacterized protein n=1 Tax=Dendrobium nobile TaxID=94219 RepID=A0A8T3AX73_DENNO|nr:hypothetical protein KFK09_018514 [Dendrobium nobile]
MEYLLERNQQERRVKDLITTAWLNPSKKMRGLLRLGNHRGAVGEDARGNIHRTRELTARANWRLVDDDQERRRIGRERGGGRGLGGFGRLGLATGVGDRRERGAARSWGRAKQRETCVWVASPGASHATKGGGRRTWGVCELEGTERGVANVRGTCLKRSNQTAP